MNPKALWQPLAHLGLFLVLAVGMPATAQVSWYQVPGQPIWVDAGVGWRVQAMGAASGLRLERKGAGRIEVYVEKLTKPEALLERVQSELTSRYEGAKLSLNGTALSGEVPRDALRLEVQGEATAVDQYAMAVVALSSKAAAAGLKKHIARISGAVRHQWARPGGGDILIPRSGLILRQPEAGWQSKTDGSVLRLVSALGRNTLEVRAEYRGEKATAEALLEKWSATLLPPAVVWAEPVRKKHGALSVQKRQGTITVDGRKWTALVAVAAIGEGHVVVVATEQNFGGDSRAGELESVVDSLRLPLK